MPGRLDIPSLVHRKEKLYYAVMVSVSLLAYLALGLAVLADPAVLLSLGYVLLFAVAIFAAHGMMIGRLRGNGIKVTTRQFPDLNRMVLDNAKVLEMDSIPDVFVMESGGVLNAFATRFLGRDFVVLHSDVLALARQQGEAAVGFIVSHELAHLKRGHLKNRWLINPARFVPYLGAAYSRACEYTCDRMATYCRPDGAVPGLLALAAGPQLYTEVDPIEYAKQAESEAGFWMRRAELLSSHPHLSKRIAAVLHGGAVVNAEPARTTRVPAFEVVGS